MSDNKEEDTKTTSEKQNSIFNEKFDEMIMESAENLSKVIQNPENIERIQKIIELELSGEIRAFSRDNLVEGLRENFESASSIIISSIERDDILDDFEKFNFTENVFDFLKHLNLLYHRRARMALFYSTRRDDWIKSGFEIETKEQNIIINMELIKGSGEIVCIKGSQFSFLNLVAKIADVLKELEWSDVLAEESSSEFIEDMNAFIDAVTGRAMEDDKSE